MISAARGYAGKQRPEFAELVGTSVPTLTRWEGGDFAPRNYGSRDQRRALAERIIRASGCPAEWFELTETEPGFEERLEALEHAVSALVRRAEGRAEEAIDAESDTPPDQPSDEPGEEDEPGRANG